MIKNIEQNKSWEDYITLNSNIEKKFTVLKAPLFYSSTNSGSVQWKDLDCKEQLIIDTYPLPETEDREGYFGGDHFSYWASGLNDCKLLLETASKFGLNDPQSFLDLGCASGRITRHMPQLKPKMKTYGCDINRLHVEWCNKFLPKEITTFQNTSIPSLQLESNSIDIVSAYSVFTHIESMETAWLMEIRRILRPGGMAWITVHTENTLYEMTPDWPLWNAVVAHPMMSNIQKFDDSHFTDDRLCIRWHCDRSYSTNVFYKEEYLKSAWGRIMNVADFRRRFPSYQDVIILVKN